MQTRIAFESCALDASRLQNTFCPIPTEILYACLPVIVNFLCKTVGTQSDIENVRNYTVCAKKNYSFLKVSECYSNTWVPLGVRRLYMWRCICEQVQSRRSEALSFTFERSALRRWIEKQAYEVCKGQWYNEDSYEAWICSVWNSRCMRDSTSRTNHKRKQLWKFKSIFISYIVFLN